MGGAVRGVVAALVLAGCGGGEEHEATQARLDGEEQHFLALVDAYRVEQGLQPLEVSSSLVEEAECRASEWVRFGTLGGRFSLCVGEEGEGENRIRTCPTAESCLEAWKRSSAEDQNLRRPGWRAHGVARVQDAHGEWVWVHLFN